MVPQDSRHLGISVEYEDCPMMRTVIAGDMEVGLSLGKEGMGDKM